MEVKEEKKGKKIGTTPPRLSFSFANEKMSKLAMKYDKYFICNSDVSTTLHTGSYCRPLQSYLGIKQQEWEKELGRLATISDKNKWLCYCKPFLFKILRDVSRGLTIVYDNNLHYEGGLSIFVTPEGDGKLQLFGKAIEIENSALGVKLEEVRQMVSNVIGYPFNIIDVETDPGFQFSSEDMFLFDILHEHNLKFASYKWILDNPFIWTGGERFDFIIKLDTLIDKQDIRLKSLAIELASMCGDKYENAFPMSRHLANPNLLCKEGKEREFRKVFPDYYADVCRGLLSLSMHCKSLKQEWASWDMVQAELHSTN